MARGGRGGRGGRTFFVALVVGAAVVLLVVGVLALAALANASNASNTRPSWGSWPPRMGPWPGYAPPASPAPATRVVLDPNSAGEPEVYGQLGYVEFDAPDGLDGGGPKRVLPLYGRRSIARRDRWFYYTSYGGIKVPVFVGGRDCLAEVGCDEISDGDMVDVPVAGGSGVAVVYRHDRV